MTVLYHATPTVDGTSVNIVKSELGPVTLTPVAEPLMVVLLLPGLTT